MLPLNSKAVSRLLGVFLILFLLGVLAILMRWDYKFLFISIGGIGAAILTMVRFILLKNKSKIDFVKYPAISLFFISRILTAIHLPYNQIITCINVTLLLIWVIWNLVENDLQIHQIKSTIVLISIGATFIGILFKIMHYPFASISLIIGFSGFSYSIIQKFIVKAH